MKIGTERIRKLVRTNDILRQKAKNYDSVIRDNIRLRKEIRRVKLNLQIVKSRERILKEHLKEKK